MVCAQGLANRIEPRIYLLFDDVDRLWLQVYNERHGVTFDEAKDLFNLIRLHANKLEGYVVYDDTMLHSANVAMTYGSIHNAVPASPSVADELSKMSLEKTADLRGRWRNRIEAYEWELEHLMPECHERIVGSMCVDPGWLHPLHHIRDYLVAAKAFSFDLSTRMVDRKENTLFDKILGRISSLGVVLGWHCSRDMESEHVARAARNGFFVLCNLRSPNLSVHSGIMVNYRFEQKHVKREVVSVEDKVYVTFIQSDGDAVWAMHNFQNGNWLDGRRGEIPYTWEIQPLIVDLAPGMLEYYYRTATVNDYLIAGPSGAGYTYPSLNKRLDEFLEQTRSYLQICDLRSALIMNRDPRICYEELEDSSLPFKFINDVDTRLGYVHGYRGSGLTPSIFIGNVPWIHTTAYIDGSSDVFQEITKFGRGCGFRPLFIAIHVRESMKIASLLDAVKKLNPEVYKVVNLDEFLLTLRLSKEEGRYTEAFPQTDFLKEGLKAQGRSLWEGYYQRLTRLEKLIVLTQDQMLSESRKVGYDVDEGMLPDVIGYEALETTLYLIRSALLIKGVYVNYRSDSIEDFLREYADLPDVDVVKAVYELWRNWETAVNDLEHTRELAERVVRLGKALDKKLVLQSLYA